MTTNTTTPTALEVIRDVPRGHFKHVLFDFDGTISLMREGWQRIMGPVMIEMICGDTQPTPEIEAEVEAFIDDTTGVQTILQMEGLIELVRKHGRVPEDQILDAHGYKEIYNDRLMVPVRERIARLESGELSVEDATVRGSIPFVQGLAERGLTLYLASGTDHDDVVNEATKLGVAQYFNGGIYGALRTYEESNKEKVIQQIIADHDLHGTEVLVCGDGPVELRNAKDNGCVALGVASDEVKGSGWDQAKCGRLKKAGADLLVPDFAEHEALLTYLFTAE